MHEFILKFRRFVLHTNASVAAFLERSSRGANRRTLVIVCALGLIVLVSYLFVIQPPDQFPVGDLVSIPEGTSLHDAAQILYDNGTIRSPLVFELLVSIEGSERSIHAGDYLFTQPLTIFGVAHAVAVGQYGLAPVRISVPEGATAKEMSVLFASRLQRFDAKQFLAAAQPDEGYLFPDTYYFLPNATESVVLQAMRQNFDTHVVSIEPKIASSTHSLHDIVIMASIVEREASNSADRHVIAGVLWNRIAKGMPLQVDSPFWYSLGKGTFDLTVQDLKNDSPYNTYVNKGLPPTAISNPSLDSLDAAADPTPNDYLYFLADRSGVTHFCKTYSCQLANKAKYF